MIGLYIGKKSTMGFKTNRQYDVYSKIEIVRRGGIVFGDTIPCICIYDKNSTLWCPYQSLEKVLENWKFKG